MIDNKKILAIIPARGGSKGIPQKNIMDTAGRPLIYWTIKAAQQSQYIDTVVCSTDDENIANVATEYGCSVPFLRSEQLSSDTACSVDLVHDLLIHYSTYDYVMLLQPTSPLRTAEDIDSALASCVAKQAMSCVSVSLSKAHPAWMFHASEACMQPVLKHNASRRQDLPEVYQLNGAIYITQVDWFMRHCTFMDDLTLPYVMPSERSIDIDEIADWVLADYYLRSA